jgi:hypothetical protein
MKNTKKFFFLILAFVSLSGCATLDKLTEEETMVDPETGKVKNKEEIRSSERVDIANDNKQIEITKSANVVVIDDTSEVYVMNKDRKFMGVIYNPHPRIVQHILLTDPDGEVIANESIQPKEFREVYALRGSEKDFHLIATWTLGIHQKTIDVLFPKGTAKCRDERGKKCHFKTRGFGELEY